MNLSLKKIAILGCGRSGLAAAKLARACGAGNIRLFDVHPAATCEQGDFPLTAGATEEDARAYGADLVIVSPGIEADIPWTLAFAERAAELIGETEFACRHFDGTLVAITGTNGKTTTTALIEHMLQAAGLNARACGNYGLPLSEIALDKSVRYAVTEVSSFQMETIRLFRPDLAVWLNFAPDHMDRYKTIEDYFKAKLRVFENMGSSQTAIVRYGENLPSLRARLLTFSSQGEPATVTYRNGWIYEGKTRLVRLEDTAMAQAHNAENAMAALLVCRELGAPLQTIADAVHTFTPPHHRCETVAERDGVLWLNDSKSTNLHSTEAALRSQTRPAVLIAGGKDKGLDYSALVPLLKKKARAVVVFGQIAPQLAETFAQEAPTISVETLPEAVSQAALLAQPGDVVLFSPGTSSFDQFTGYVQRGERFRDAVLQTLAPASSPAQINQ